MVNMGKPSRGCDTCKKRRIKCDLGRPECQRCIQSKRQCPGVPDEKDILFRNETNTVTTRARVQAERPLRIRQAREASQTPSHGSAPSGQELIHWDGDKGIQIGLRVEDPVRPADDEYNLSSMTRLCSMTFESLAISFYFHNFITNRGAVLQLNPSLTILSDTFLNAPVGSPVRRATAACAVASMARWPDMASFKPVAQTLYGQALRDTAAAIADPQKALTDETLLGVMMLGMFEAMTPSQSTLDSHVQHLNGAMALVRARGARMFTEPRSLSLFRGVKNLIIMNAVHSPSTVNFTDDQFWFEDQVDDSDTVNKLFNISSIVPMLRARMTSLSAKHTAPEDIAEIRGLLEDAFATDAKLTEWYAERPEEYWFKVLPAEECDEGSILWGSHVHACHDKLASGTLNLYRTMRMFVLGIMAQCLVRLAKIRGVFRFEAFYKSIQYILRQLVDDVCASKQFILGCIPAYRTSPRYSREAIAEEAVGAFMLFRPLHISRGVECIPAEQEEWLRGVIEHFGKLFGHGLCRESLSHKPPTVAGPIWTEFPANLEPSDDPLDRYISDASELVAPHFGPVRP